MALAVIAAGAALLLRPQSHDDSAGGSPVASVTAGPADAEAAAATTSAPYTIKAEPSEVATDAPLSTSTGRVDVVLTYVMFDQASGTVQASGFAAGVVEDGGTCTLTLTRDGKEVTATTTAEADAKTTSCGLLESPAGLAAGTWEAALTYASADAHGESGSQEVSVR
jgi:hypothetical protein